jgi:LacI family transcriptional regulator
LVAPGRPVTLSAFFKRPACAPPHGKNWTWNFAGFLDWVKKENPDVVITNGDDVQSWLKKMKITVPDHMGILRLDALASRPESGLPSDFQALASGAIDLVTRMVETGEFGLPTLPKAVQISHGWHEGKTLRTLAK